jgi:hypothetical protein
MVCLLTGEPDLRRRSSARSGGGGPRRSGHRRGVRDETKNPGSLPRSAGGGGGGEIARKAGRNFRANRIGVERGEGQRGERKRSAKGRTQETAWGSVTSPW